MRQITKTMANAFYNDQPKNLGNTAVVLHGDMTYLVLHGNVIAKKKAGFASVHDVSFTLAGWPTPTTRERLKGLLIDVVQRKGEQYYTRGIIELPIDDDTWYSVHELNQTVTG